LPVLRGRFHHRFLHPGLGQPNRQSTQFRVSSAEFTPLKTELAHLRCIRNYHRQHLLVYVYTGYSVPRFHSPFFPDQGRERTGKNLKHHFALKPTPASGISNAHLFVQTHAPDQTGWRPQPIHCPTDLNYPAPLIWMLPGFKDVFMTLRGPPAHGDRMASWMASCGRLAIGLVVAQNSLYTRGGRLFLNKPIPY